MSQNLRRLNIAALTCVLLALSPAAGAQVPAATGKHPTSLTSPLDEKDPLQQWFREQDRLIDDSLVHLTRIEGLVSDLHRLISQMPDPGQAIAPAPTPAAAPIPAPKPVSPPPVTPAPEPADDLLEHAPLLGGALAVILLLGMWLRRRRSAAEIAPEMTEPMPEPAEPAPPTPVPPPRPKPAAHAPSPAPPTPSPATAPTPKEPVTQSPSLSLPVVQNDQAMELAEIMLSMGLGHGAANTLVEQIRREPKQALMHWLKLLEIYRRNGQQAEFEKSAEELRQHFNVQPEDWNAQPGNQRSLEDYPHIAARIVELWGKQSCLAYLQNLLDDNRGGARSGFPQSVAEELLILSAMLKDEF